jgi:hypothetical protein
MKTKNQHLLCQNNSSGMVKLSFLHDLREPCFFILMVIKCIVQVMLQHPCLLNLPATKTSSLSVFRLDCTSSTDAFTFSSRVFHKLNSIKRIVL